MGCDSPKSLPLPDLAVGLHFRISLDRLFTSKEIDDFISVYERSNVTERELSQYLREHPKFLFALGAYNCARPEVEFPTTTPELPPQLRLDFLLRDSRGTWDILELKKPAIRDKPLILGLPQRRRFSAELEIAIAQLRTYLYELDRPAVQEYFRSSGMLLVQPQAWLLIGRDKDLPIFDRRLIERDLAHSMRIVTYDELTDLAKQRLLIVSQSVLLPQVPGFPLRLELFGQADLSRASSLLSQGISSNEDVQNIVATLLGPLRLFSGAPVSAETCTSVREYVKRLVDEWGCQHLERYFHKDPYKYQRVDLDKLINEVHAQLFISLAEIAKHMQRRFRIGSRLQVVEGPLRGATGILKAVTPKGRLLLGFDLLNRRFELEVEGNQAIQSESGQVTGEEVLVRIDENITGGEYVLAIFDSGRFLMLGNNSVWQIAPSNRGVCSSWEVGTNVRIEEGDPQKFNNSLVNIATGQIVQAKLFKKP